MEQARKTQRTFDGKKGITNWLGLIFHQTTSVQKTWTGPGILIYSSRQRIHGRHPPPIIPPNNNRGESLIAHRSLTDRRRSAKAGTVPYSPQAARTRTHTNVCTCVRAYVWHDTTTSTERRPPNRMPGYIHLGVDTIPTPSRSLDNAPYESRSAAI